jgi:hypothetical protein
MKKVLLIATALAGLTLAAPSFAQSVSGTVGLSGSVAPRCVVNGSGGGSTFSGAISFGELTKTNGTLRGDMQNSSPVSGAVVKASVTCTTANALVGVSATELATTGTAPSGFSSALDYTAELDVDKAGGGTGQFTYTTTTSNQSTSPTTTALGDAVSNSNNNVRVSVYSFNSVGSNSNTLLAGTYSGVVYVTIAPN